VSPAASTTAAAGLVFAAALTGEECTTLRDRVAALLGHCTERPVRVDTVLGAHSRVCRGGRESGPPASYMLFDFQRIVLYDEPDDAEQARIDSVVLWLVDAYPHQPAPRFAAHAAVEPYRFLYAVDVLDVLRVLWPRRRPGVVTVCDLATGEIRSTPARVHPEAAAPPPVQAAGGESLVVPLPLHLRARRTDSGLRARRKLAPGGEASPLVGVVREVCKTWDTADLPLVAAKVAWNGGQSVQTCFGKGFRPGAAAAVAGFEADERYGAIFRRADEALVHGSLHELGDLAVDPRLLFYDRPVFDEGGPPLSETERLHWTWATDPLRKRTVLVPAQEVWFRTRTAEERRFVRSTTNACALGNSLEEAAVFAVFEAIERDAFLTAWYTRRPCDPIDLDSVEHEGFQLLRRRFALAFPDYSFHLFDATTDLGVPAVIGFAVRRRGSGPRVFASAASRLSPARACFAALGDLAGFYPRMSEARREELRRLLAEPDLVRGPSEHYGVYALDETFERLGFLDFSGPPRTTVSEMESRRLSPSGEKYELRNLLETIAARASSVGASVLLKDVTHRWVADRGLRCVRAITPGLYPLWFGLRDRRFGVTERLAQLAYRWTGNKLLARDDFNLEVHPLS
jgi:ribosomal protein S12 methylthiotransferase accessory factor